ncbi:MAG TPA: hypothetical protein VMN39_12195 [Longimicrobiaceae bacterium]|nr:hypothetical protein [Longimicrobiaceae bacterium]
MVGDRGYWRRLVEDGAEWETRVESGSEGSGPHDEAGEVIEFVCVDGLRKPRRLAVPPDSIESMNDADLRRAYRRARPIGGDHYGRPGKPAGDAL